jgi:hypothetical protein
MARLPAAPGVYRFQDARDKVLYIGRPMQLRRRAALSRAGGALNRDAIDVDRNGRMAFWPACMERTWLVTNVDSGWAASAFSAVVECRS